MKRSVLKALLFSISALLVIALAGCGKNNSTVVARVGDREIMIEDIDRFFERAGFRFESAEKELETRQAMLDSLINQNLLIIGSYAYNLENHDEVLRVIEGEKHRFLLDALFEKEILSKATPSEAEIKDWYVRTGEKIKASHILVDSLETARQVLQELKDGAAFEELAVKYSIDPSVKRNQGDLGWFTWGSMVENFQDAAFKMNPGEISQPIKSEFGWHIINVVDRQELKDRPSYDEMKPLIKNQIIEYRRGTLLKEFSDKLREKYPITVEEPTCQFVLNKLEYLYPDTIGGLPRWRNNIDMNQLDESELTLVMGRWDGGEINLGEYLRNINRVREDMRPDLDQYDSVAEIIFQMEFQDILTVEARRQGLENDESYKKRLKLFKELAMADVLRHDTIPYNSEVNEGEIQHYYDSHPEEFMTPVRFHLLEIQVTDRGQADKYATTIKSEARFKSVASSATMRAGKKQVGGDLGIVTGQVYPQLYEAALELKDGQIAGPIESGLKRWSVIWVKERLEPELEDFTKVQNRIMNQLASDKSNFLYVKWIDSMKNEYPVTVYEDVLKASVNYDAYEKTADSIDTENN